MGRPRAVGAFSYFGVTLIPVARGGRCPRNKEYSLYPAIARVCGALIGFALALYVPLNLLLIPLLILAGLLSAILTKILINTLSIKFNLPVLSIPFVLVTWAGLIFLRYIPSEVYSSLSPGSLHFMSFLL